MFRKTAFLEPGSLLIQITVLLTSLGEKKCHDLEMSTVLDRTTLRYKYVGFVDSYRSTIEVFNLG